VKKKELETWKFSLNKATKIRSKVWNPKQATRSQSITCKHSCIAWRMSAKRTTSSNDNVRKEQIFCHSIVCSIHPSVVGP